MKKLFTAVCAAALLSSPVLADAHKDDHIVFLGDVVWQEVIPGVQLALGWGDPAAGMTSGFFGWNPVLASRLMRIPMITGV